MQDHVARGAPFVVRGGAAALGLPVPLGPRELGAMRLAGARVKRADRARGGAMRHFDARKPWAPLVARDYEAARARRRRGETAAARRARRRARRARASRSPAACCCATVRGGAPRERERGARAAARARRRRRTETTLNLWLSRAGTRAAPLRRGAQPARDAPASSGCAPRARRRGRVLRGETAHAHRTTARRKAAAAARPLPPRPTAARAAAAARARPRPRRSPRSSCARATSSSSRRSTLTRSPP